MLHVTGTKTRQIRDLYSGSTWPRLWRKVAIAAAFAIPLGGCSLSGQLDSFFPSSDKSERTGTVAAQSEKEQASLPPPADLAYARAAANAVLSRGEKDTSMELARAPLGLPADGYRIEPQLAEIAFGDWEGFTIAQLHSRDPHRIAAREQDKWHFVPPGGESYEAVSARMREWYEGLTRDTVAVAHGGTARGLIAYLGIAKPAAAPLLDIAQGVVYVFEGDRLTRYA